MHLTKSDEAKEQEDAEKLERDIIMQSREWHNYLSDLPVGQKIMAARNPVVMDRLYSIFREQLDLQGATEVLMDDVPIEEENAEENEGEMTHDFKDEDMEVTNNDYNEVGADICHKISVYDHLGAVSTVGIMPESFKPCFVFAMRTSEILQIYKHPNSPEIVGNTAEMKTYSMIGRKFCETLCMDAAAHFEFTPEAVQNSCLKILSEKNVVRMYDSHCYGMGIKMPSDKTKAHAFFAAWGIAIYQSNRTHYFVKINLDQFVKFMFENAREIRSPKQGKKITAPFTYGD